MDKLGDRHLSEFDIKMMGARAFVVGKLSSGEADFQEVENTATAHLGVSTFVARAAIWTLLADVEIDDSNGKLSLAVPEAPTPPPTSTAPTETV